MALEFLLLVIGIMVLVKFSNVTIEKAAELSRLTGISHFVIGFIFIAVSTSLPELSIAIISALQGENQLSLGNLVGANITLLTLVFGVMALAGFQPEKKDFMEIDQAVITTTIIGLSLIALKISDLAVGIFAIILFYAFSREIVREGVDVGANSEYGLPIIEKIKATIMLSGSVLIVVASAYVVTNSAIIISRTFGVAETLLGATIISLGTTLPEISVNIAAIRKNDVGLAIGDTIGSIVANLTLILGISSIINPITIGRIESFVIGFFVFVSLIFLFFATRLKFDKPAGLVLVIMYLFYLASIAVIL